MCLQKPTRVLAPHDSKLAWGAAEVGLRRVHEPFLRLIYLLFTALLRAPILSSEKGLDIDFREGSPTQWRLLPLCTYGQP